MSDRENYDVLVLGSGTGGKLVAWTMAKEGKRTAIVERKYIGGSCSNIVCLPSKNIIHTAKVVSLFRRHQEFGIQRGTIRGARNDLAKRKLGFSPRRLEWLSKATMKFGSGPIFAG